MRDSILITYTVLQGGGSKRSRASKDFVKFYKLKSYKISQNPDFNKFTHFTALKDGVKHDVHRLSHQNKKINLLK